MKAKLVVLVLAVLALPFSNAFSQTEPKKGGFFIEPMITYEKTDLDIDYPAPLGSSSGDQKGLGVGARLGFHIYESVFIGVDGRYNKHDFENDSDDGDFKTDASGHNYGLVVGFQLPTEVSFRVWGTYIINGALDPDEENSLDVKFEDAKGYRVGAGIMFGKISLNIEYQDLTYEKAKLQSIGGFDPNTSFSNVELDSKGYIASISFPFSL